MRAWPPALSLVLALAAPGCLYVGGRARSGPDLPADIAASLVPGRTTRAEVLARLGPPRMVRRMRPGEALPAGSPPGTDEILTWQQDRAALDGTLLILFNTVQAGTQTDLLVVFVDARGVVLDAARGGDA